MPKAMPLSPPSVEKHDGLCIKKLGQDGAPGGHRRGFAQADFARAFANGDKHDVHDADAADQKRNRGHNAEQNCEGVGGGLPRRLNVGHVADIEIVIFPRRQTMARLRSSAIVTLYPRGNVRDAFRRRAFHVQKY